MPAPERGNPRRWEADRRRIETDERVSGSDHHLTGAGRARGQPRKAAASRSNNVDPKAERNRREAE